MPSVPPGNHTANAGDRARASQGGSDSPGNDRTWQRLRETLSCYWLPDALDALPAAEILQQLEQLTQEITTVLPEAATPHPRPGSTAAVAASVVRLCQAFIHGWNGHEPVTPQQHRTFRRDLSVVVTMLRTLT